MGLWELAVARIAALAESDAPREMVWKATQAERDAFLNWQRVSRECGA